MATDHHHSAFDQDDFDRYDTFEDPVVGTTNPDREGFFGDFGRLLDQIRIANAANKLDDNVAVGEDRALNVTGNWAAVPHEELYASVHTNNNPAEAYALAREWTQLGNMMAENSRVMDETIRSTESGWVGPAAEVARQATLKLATWGGDAAQTSQYMGTRIADQGLAAERAKASMPEPVQFDYEQMLRQGFATGGLAGLNQAFVDVQMASAQARTAHAQAAQVMAQMESHSRSVDETTPRFVRPPEVTDGAASPVNSLMGAQMPASPRMTLPNGQLTPAGFEGASLPAGGTAAAFAGGTPAGFSGGGMPGGGVVTGGAGVPDFSGMAAGLTGGSASGSASGTSAQRSPGTYTPPKIEVPDIDIGTSTAGYSPTTPVTGGHAGGTKFGSGYQPPDLSNLLPPSIAGGKGRDSNSPGYVPPKLPTGINPATGLPFTPDEIRRGVPSLRGGMPGLGGGSGFGGAGGFGSGGGAGGGAGGYGGAGASAGGFGRAGMPGMGASLGAVAAAEQAAARGAAAGMAGQSGASGSPGMGAPGAGGAKGGGGDNDKEHRNKYATNEKVVEEPGRMVPSVIGEKSAKQLKEEHTG